MRYYKTNLQLMCVVLFTTAGCVTSRLKCGEIAGS